MNPRDHPQTEGTQRRALPSPVLRLGLGVAVLAICLDAGYVFVTGASTPRRDQPEALQASHYALYAALVTSGLFWSVEAYWYSAKQTAISWIFRTLLSGLLASGLIVFLGSVLSAESGASWLVSNLFILVGLYFFWRWKFGLSRMDALNLGIAAMPVALFVLVAVTNFLSGVLPDLR